MDSTPSGIGVGSPSKFQFIHSMCLGCHRKHSASNSFLDSLPHPDFPFKAKSGTSHKCISIKLGIYKPKKHQKEGFTGVKGGDIISAPQKTMTNPARSAKLLGKKSGKGLEMRGKDDLSVEIKERDGKVGIF